jgi:hypothetical protein
VSAFLVIGKILVVALLEFPTDARLECEDDFNLERAQVAPFQKSNSGIHTHRRAWLSARIQERQPGATRPASSRTVTFPQPTGPAFFSLKNSN